METFGGGLLRRFAGDGSRFASAPAAVLRLSFTLSFFPFLSHGCSERMVYAALITDKESVSMVLDRLARFRFFQLHDVGPISPTSSLFVFPFFFLVLFCSILSIRPSSHHLPASCCVLGMCFRHSYIPPPPGNEVVTR